LQADERKAATALYRALHAANQELAAGTRDALQLQKTMRCVLDTEHSLSVDYAEIVDAETFESVTRVHRTCYALIAAFVGKTRLIDNLLIEAANEDEFSLHL
jgi:pantoate--beta-alanine ligase